VGQIITVDFHDQQLVAFERDGKVFIAVRPIAEGMGLEWSSQWRRIQRDAVLGPAVAMMATPFSRHGQEELCLPLDMMHGWLFTLDESRVKDDETRERVLLYKRECYEVLFNHFYGKALAATAADPSLPDPAESEAAKLKMVTEARLTFGHKAAQQMWFKKGLDTVPAMFEPSPQPELFDPPDGGPPAAQAA
jgi:hypothetical protein